MNDEICDTKDHHNIQRALPWGLDPSFPELLFLFLFPWLTEKTRQEAKNDITWFCLRSTSSGPMHYQEVIAAGRGVIFTAMMVDILALTFSSSCPLPINEVFPPLCHHADTLLIMPHSSASQKSNLCRFHPWVSLSSGFQLSLAHREQWPRPDGGKNSPSFPPERLL